MCFKSRDSSLLKLLKSSTTVISILNIGLIAGALLWLGFPVEVCRRTSKTLDCSNNLAQLKGGICHSYLPDILPDGKYFERCAALASAKKKDKGTKLYDFSLYFTAVWWQFAVYFALFSFCGLLLLIDIAISFKEMGHHYALAIVRLLLALTAIVILLTRFWVYAEEHEECFALPKGWFYSEIYAGSYFFCDLSCAIIGFMRHRRSIYEKNDREQTERFANAKSLRSVKGQKNIKEKQTSNQNELEKPKQKDPVKKRKKQYEKDHGNSSS